MSDALGPATYEGSVYRRRFRLRTDDVDLNRLLRTSRLLELMQDAAIAHTEHVGMGREKTLDAGILWVVARQHVEVARWPRYDEEIELEAWPGDMQHVLFPRFALVRDAEGHEIARSSALWLLMSAQTRAMVFPARAGVHVDGVAHGPAIALPGAVAGVEGGARACFAVPYSACDLNGHLNNARALDAAEDLLAGPAQGVRLRTLDVAFEGEAAPGERLTVTWRENAAGAQMEAARDGRAVFRLAMEY
jgi:medium-chain acyl-[acyl-carrier-protein] hydrolase